MNSSFLGLKEKNIFLLMMAIILVMPTTLYLYFQLSVSIGLTIFMLLLWVVIYYLDKSIYMLKKSHIVNLSIVMIFLLIHTLFVYVLFEMEPNYSRMLPSIGLFGALILTSFIFVEFVFKMKEEYIFRALKILFYLMLGVGYFSVVLIKNGLASIAPKSMLFWVEPSHFAMVFTPVALFNMYYMNLQNKLLFITLIMILGVLLPNLSLIIGTLVIIFCVLERKYLILMLVTFTILIVLFPNNILLYISTRLDIFSEVTRNTSLSLLVYLSGLERGYLDLLDSYGLGIGFNDFGYMGKYGKFTAILLQSNKTLLNFNDGGFLFAKLLGEFGIIAIVLVLVYFYYLIKVFIRFKKSVFNSAKDILFSSFFITFSLYIFVRGMGYFTPVTFMFLASIYWYNLRYKKKESL